MATVSKERVTLSLSATAISFLDSFKKVNLDCAPSHTNPTRKRGRSTDLSSLARRVSVRHAVRHVPAQCAIQVKRVSRSRAMELLIEERQREARRKLFAAEARAFFAQQDLDHRDEADAFEKAALEDWRKREP